MVTPKSNLWHLADAKLDGKLEERILELRADGVSWRTMAVLLEPEVGFKVGFVTLRDWAETLGKPERETP